MSEFAITGELNGLLLAYVGDAQIELLVRKKLVETGGKIGSINKKADALVSAKGQCDALEKIMPYLTETELAVFKRGKNVHVNSVPKSCTLQQYLKATGFEAIFGHLSLEGDTERMEFLLDKAYFS